jgi:hypothetical protein
MISGLVLMVMVIETAAEPDPELMTMLAEYVPGERLVGSAVTLSTAGVAGAAAPLDGVTLSQLADCPGLGEIEAVKGSDPPPLLETVMVCVRAVEVFE